MSAHYALSMRLSRSAVVLLVSMTIGGTFAIAGMVQQWRTVTSTQIGRSDFTSMYVGGTLWREGHRDDLYDEATQAPLHAQLIAPDHEGNLPFVNPPAAAVVLAPLTAVSLNDAYRLWSALQVTLLLAAGLIAAMAAPAPRVSIPYRFAAAIVATASVGTLGVLLLGQWDGVSAMGLALTYAVWRRGHRATGGVVLAATSALAKPHLAIGLAAYVLGRRDRRVLAGAAGGLMAILAISWLAVGTAGIVGFLHTAAESTHRWHLASFVGFSGFFGAWVGDTPVAYILSTVASLAGIAACAVLGARWRHDQTQLEPTLAGAAALSLLAAPHLLNHDLALLGPVVAWSLVVTLNRALPLSYEGDSLPETRPFSTVIVLWLMLNVAALADFGNDASAPPGRLVPWALLGVIVVAWWARMPLGSSRVPAT